MRVRRMLLPGLTLFTLLALMMLSRPPLASAQTATPAQSIDFQRLNSAIDTYLQAQGFVPGTARQGSVYVEDLKSGEALTVNPDVIYSGVSMLKLAVLITFYAHHPETLNATQALLIARMMLCSDNNATNALMSTLANTGIQGSAETGAGLITKQITSDGFAPFKMSRSFSNLSNPNPPSSDPKNADADPYNITTPAVLGKLLSAVYHCARNEPGGFNDASTHTGTEAAAITAQATGEATAAATVQALDASQITPEGCRHIMDVMRYDHLGALIEAGIPDGTLIAHKQGWDGETHGDVAFISTPGGDYIVSITLHQRSWLNYKASFPAMSEVSRMVYNAYNPTHKLSAIHAQPIPLACPLDSKALDTLQKPDAPPIP